MFPAGSAADAPIASTEPGTKFSDRHVAPSKSNASWTAWTEKSVPLSMPALTKPAFDTNQFAPTRTATRSASASLGERLPWYQLISSI